MSGLVSSDESKRLEYFSLARVMDDFQEEQCGVFSESRCTLPHQLHVLVGVKGFRSCDDLSGGLFWRGANSAAALFFRCNRNCGRGVVPHVGSSLWRGVGPCAFSHVFFFFCF